MEIFNITISGADVEWFLNMTCSDKIAWIRANTNVQDEDKITEFLKNPPRKTFTGCCGGEKKKSKWDYANISEGISEAATNSTESAEVGGNGSQDSESGSASVKTGKKGRTRTRR